ncbi:hypothetical protein FPG92_05255 [Flavobacterium psychrophilum]|nr:hypothetical protein FPG92_05255 [Flavobacterium psychrophilum]
MYFETNLINLTSRGLASVGDLVSQMYKLKTNFQVQNQLYSLPKTPIAPNRCACCTTKNKIQNQLFLCVLILITTVNQLVKNN